METITITREEFEKALRSAYKLGFETAADCQKPVSLEGKKMLSDRYYTPKHSAKA